MEIIILILMALGNLVSPAQFTEEYKNTHQAQINQAQTIYHNDQYVLNAGGVIIDNEVNP